MGSAAIPPSSPARTVLALPRGMVLRGGGARRPRKAEAKSNAPLVESPDSADSTREISPPHNEATAGAKMHPGDDDELESCEGVRWGQQQRAKLTLEDDSESHDKEEGGRIQEGKGLAERTLEADGEEPNDERFLMRDIDTYIDIDAEKQAAGKEWSLDSDDSWLADVRDDQGPDAVAHHRAPRNQDTTTNSHPYPHPHIPPHPHPHTHESREPPRFPPDVGGGVDGGERGGGGWWGGGGDGVGGDVGWEHVEAKRGGELGMGHGEDSLGDSDEEDVVLREEEELSEDEILLSPVSRYKLLMHKEVCVTICIAYYYLGVE